MCKTVYVCKGENKNANFKKLKKHIPDLPHPRNQEVNVASKSCLLRLLPSLVCLPVFFSGAAQHECEWGWGRLSDHYL